MKKIRTGLFLVVLICIIACNQPHDGFIIKGTVTELEVQNKAIIYGNQGDTVAIADIVDGKFILTGKINGEPHNSRVSIYKHGEEKKTGYPVSFIISNDAFELVANPAYQYVKGGDLNNEVNGYKFEQEYLNKQLENNKLRDSLFSDIDFYDPKDKERLEHARALSIKGFRELNALANNYRKKMLESKCSELGKLHIANSYGGPDFSAEDRMAFFDAWEAKNGEHDIINRYRQYQNENKAREAMAETVYKGMDYKEVTGATVDGEVIKLSAIIEKNKYTLLEFWASWCGPCRAEFPHLKKAYEKYNEKGFEIYALSIDEDRKRWIKALEEDNPPWLRIVDYNGFKAEGIVNYAVRGIPASFLISNEGKVVAMGNEVRGFGLDEKLEELFD